ncbi:hypothetical protein MPH_04043 [Macrophomina phaseolina MS6]|uniref:Uncharacterized protein n=1 Tax=Macrophomina phaseolina (strain MS6) TaxID=1126212 RepID=K2S160_MACPH|nr:hypothetical protein MPH_04043 [Macrophomina phaseolina MS6]
MDKADCTGTDAPTNAVRMRRQAFEYVNELNEINIMALISWQLYQQLRIARNECEANTFVKAYQDSRRNSRPTWARHTQLDFFPRALLSVGNPCGAAFR